MAEIGNWPKYINVYEIVATLCPSDDRHSLTPVRHETRIGAASYDEAITKFRSFAPTHEVFAWEKPDQGFTRDGCHAKVGHIEIQRCVLVQSGVLI
jgi:hypothetical protein